MGAAIWVLALLVIFTLPAEGQAVFPDENGAALKGITTFDARVVTRTWLEMPTSEDQFRENAQVAFELALRRDGVVVDLATPNYLICAFNVAYNDGLVAYVWTVYFYDFALEGVHPLLWKAEGIATTGRNNFAPESAAKSCVDAFANEWLKQNPR